MILGASSSPLSLDVSASIADSSLWYVVAVVAFDVRLDLESLLPELPTAFRCLSEGRILLDGFLEMSPGSTCLLRFPGRGGLASHASSTFSLLQKRAPTSPSNAVSLFVLASSSIRHLAVVKSLERLHYFLPVQDMERLAPQPVSGRILDLR